jgi:hypothetical protein
MSAAISAIFASTDGTAAEQLKRSVCMSRKNHSPKPRMNQFRNFDIVDVYEPEYPHIRRWISMPRKVIYINRAASPDSKVIRVNWD